MARIYVRVRDRYTKHEFDVPDYHPAIGTDFDLVHKEAYPPAEQPRPPKHHIELAVRPGPRRTTPSTAGSRNKENHDG